MKVYTVDQDVQLEIHASAKAFLDQTSSLGWCDHKYISVATTKELKENYDEPYHHRMVIHTDEQIRAHNMLHTEFLRLKRS